MAVQVDTTPAADTPSVVQTINLHKVIDGRHILKDINIDIPVSQFTALLGANGAGKSTLLKILSTLSTPTQGQVKLFGQTLKRETAKTRAKIGMIGHQAMLYRDLSAIENLIFFGKLYNVADPEDRAIKLLKELNLADRADDPTKAFSRGMTQRLSIARALMHDPQLLLADEPFSGLDAPSSKMLEDILLQIVDTGRTIIMTHHDITQSLDLVDHVIALRAGNVVINDPASELHPDTILEEISSP